MQAMIFDVQKNSTVDGPGIRTTVFFKGCNLRCQWCHNPEGCALQPQLLFYKNRCVGCGRCKQVCPYSLEECDLCGKCEKACLSGARKICGREYTVEELVEEIVKDKLFYEVSGGGVTCSGGECMLYPEFLTELLKACKNEGVQTAVDTAGNVPYESFLKVLPYTDILLYDIKCFSEDLHRLGTGVSNALILDNLTKLSKSFKGKIIVRIPVVGGYNDDEREMQTIADFLKTLAIQKVELLPYHTLGEHKYEALGIKHTAFTVPTEQKMKEFEKLFSEK